MTRWNRKVIVKSAKHCCFSVDSLENILQCELNFMKDLSQFMKVGLITFVKSKLRHTPIPRNFMERFQQENGKNSVVGLRSSYRCNFRRMPQN
jgi:hypothetical protein